MNMASAMLVLCGVATLAGPNGTAPAIENRGIETNPPPFPAGIELNLSRATGPREDSAFTHTKGYMYEVCTLPSTGPAHLHRTAGGGRFPRLQTPWLEVLPRGRPNENRPATAHVLWCRHKTRQTAKLSVMEWAGEPGEDGQESQEGSSRREAAARVEADRVSSRGGAHRGQSSSDTADREYSMTTCRQLRWSQGREPRKKSSERNVEGEQRIQESRGSRREVQFPKRTGKSVAEPRKKSRDEHENMQPRYAAVTAVTVQIKERRALGDLQPRTSRER